MSLKPGIYKPSRFNLEIHVDDYGTCTYTLTTIVQGETVTIELGTQEDRESALIKQMKEWAVRIILEKLTPDQANPLIQAAEKVHGPRVWLRYYDQRTNILQTYQLSDDINAYLNEGRWPEED